MKPCPSKHLKVKGVVQAIKVHGQGTVLWSVLDEAGILRTSKVPALYIADAKVKLLSVNSLGDVFPEETVTFHPEGATIQECQETPAEDKSTLQGIQATTSQVQTPMSINENLPCIPSLGQLCLNHSSLQSQPQSSPRGTSTMAPQIGPHGLQENSISHENWSACQH